MPDSADFEAQVLAFEQAWHAEPAPPLTDFLGQPPEEARQRLLVELICLDLEYRWKRSAGACRAEPLTLESYLEQFSHLGSLDELPLLLIEEEYRVRQLWGDRPTHVEFLARFKHRLSQIEDRLTEVDRELAAEQASDLSPSSGGARNIRPSSDPDPRAPLAYSDYVLEQLIGAGRTGKVYRALQRSLNRRVAIKYLRKSLMREPEAIERFIIEAKTIARFQHPGIVSIHGLGKTPSSYFMAMDLIDGADLAWHVRQGVVSVSDAVDWTIQACAAIEHAHEHGVVHCDLKPGNLLLDRHGQIHVTDFGFARILTDTMVVETRIEGTGGFMAPEQVSAFWGPINPRTDVYGLGAVLFALLARQPPWQGRTLADILSRVVSARAAPSLGSRRADIPAPIDEICAKCLNKIPSERFASAGELRNALLGNW